MAWWRDRASLQRFAGDLLAGELARLRPGHAAPPGPLTGSTRLADDLGADSLERLQLATALGEAIHLHEAGIDDSLLTSPTLGEWVDVAARSLERFSARLTFRTSGSTGRPKWCVHECGDLEVEADQIAALLEGTKRLVVAVPSHHIYGFLWGVLGLGRLEAAFIDVRASAPARLATLLTAGDAVIAYPDFWRAVVRAVPRIPAGVTGVTSTAPSPPELGPELQANGLDRFIDVYGSSETAGIGWRDDAAAAYRLFGPWRRGADENELIRQRPDGTSSAVVAPDRLVWVDERHVRPAGRTENAVQVGGMNVFPARVAAVLRTHPDVAQAAVRLMRPDEGERLKAFVVPREPDHDPAALAAAVDTWVAGRLSAPERPRSIMVGAELPVGAQGKPADWPIPELRASGERSQPAN